MNMAVHDAYYLGFVRGALFVACVIAIALLIEALKPRDYGRSFSSVEPVNPADIPPPPDAPHVEE